MILVLHEKYKKASTKRRRTGCVWGSLGLAVCKVGCFLQNDSQTAVRTPLLMLMSRGQSQAELNMAHLATNILKFVAFISQ